MKSYLTEIIKGFSLRGGIKAAQRTRDGLSRLAAAAVVSSLLAGWLPAAAYAGQDGWQSPPAPVPQNEPKQGAPAQAAQTQQPAEVKSSPTQPPAASQAASAPIADSRVGVGGQQLQLSLSDAITLALRQNNDIEASRTDVEMAEFELKAARGVYDPRLTTQSFYERSSVPNASILGGGENGKITQSGVTGGASLNGSSPFAGGTYDLNLSSSRQTTDNIFSLFSPQINSGISLGYTQPLWRGLRTDENRRRIDIAKKNITLSDAEFRRRVIEVVNGVEQAYWNLVYALRNLQVQNEAVEQTRRQVESNRRQVEQGILAPIDVVEAEAQLAVFQQSAYSAQEAVTRAENALKTLVLPDRKAAEWSQPIAPVTPVSLDTPRLPLNEAVSSAISNRPELAQLQTTAEINNINTKFFRDQTKPQVDLIANYSSNGLAGTIVDRGPNPFTSGITSIQERVNELSERAGLPTLPPSVGSSPLPDELIGGFGQSFSNLLSNKYTTARVGVRLTIPLRNRTAEANVGRSLAEGRRIQSQREQLEQLIEADVRNALQAMESAQARLTAAAANREAAEKQYASEQRKFQAGTSTVFLVLQRQTELVTARGRELQAQTDLSKAIADLRRATGNTLQNYNISLVEPNRARPGAQSPVNAASHLKQ